MLTDDEIPYLAVTSVRDASPCEVCGRVHLYELVENVRAERKEDQASRRLFDISIFNHPDQLFYIILHNAEKVPRFKESGEWLMKQVSCCRTEIIIENPAVMEQIQSLQPVSCKEPNQLLNDLLPAEVGSQVSQSSISRRKNP